MIQKCRFCEHPLNITFCDLGRTPPANSYLKNRDEKELFFPLHAYVCEHCLLVQLGQFQTPDEIFSDYAYFSSYSDSWVEHAKNYVAHVTNRFHLNNHHFVVEIASNDGYLLQYFLERDIPILGIEPAQNIAQHAIAKGIPTLVKFFGLATAKEIIASRGKADLLLGNNVLAHVPNLKDFVAGLKELLAPLGIVTLEFPHLLQLIRHCQFDTIYHEHFSYFSLLFLEKIFTQYALHLFDVEEIPTHGGSLRIYIQHANGPHQESNRVAELKTKEIEFGLRKHETYTFYSQQVQKIKKDLIEFLKLAKKDNKKVAGYGAPAKGNTLLNFCGITTDLLCFTVDRSHHKQGLFLPGTHIPIFAPEKIMQEKPDYILILPWNLKEEIMNQLAFIRKWNGKFIIPIPQVIEE